LHTTSFGAGELVLDALEAGARRIVLGVGGSATVDGGTGLMQALGVAFLDAAGSPLVGLPASLVDLAKIEMAGIGKAVAGMEVVVLCDVDNPILGPSGAARVFGPQKGATAVSAETLEAALKRLCEVIHCQTGRDVSTVRGGGAAGGVAAGLVGVFGAQLVNGIDYFLDASGFDKALEAADLVITGEGRIDAQTLRGKAPMGVAIRARQRGVPVIALAGQVSDEPELALAFDAVWPIAVEPGPLAEAVKRTALDLAAAGRRIGDLIAVEGLAAVKQGKWF
jgi:glycerate kinase